MKCNTDQDVCVVIDLNGEAQFYTCGAVLCSRYQQYGFDYLCNANPPVLRPVNSLATCYCQTGDNCNVDILNMTHFDKVAPDTNKTAFVCEVQSRV